MFYLVDGKKIVAQCANEEQKQGMVRGHIIKKIAGRSSCVQVNSWELVEEPGYYWMLNGSEVELRFYTLSAGWVWSSLTFESVCRFFLIS